MTSRAARVLELSSEPSGFQGFQGFRVGPRSPRPGATRAPAALRAPQLSARAGRRGADNEAVGLAAKKKMEAQRFCPYLDSIARHILDFDFEKARPHPHTCNDT